MVSFSLPRGSRSELASKALADARPDLLAALTQLQAQFCTVPNAAAPPAPPN